ncbi:calmodulin-lysine N-methyltransferase-like isoform X1 [Asterias rubens]|uniref:calmodulin-lysine N-methyltransferase-like isoform X1 n=1 Tax=Asterias rubens TaxID=7604 RepID=UPI0014555254|nr:calmodulin-lysine N-methyltransferase-like isoform X1 [Asterias rubens]
MSETSAEKGRSDGNTSKHRWKILRNAILKKQCQHTDPVKSVSVRRFASFGLLSTKSIPTESSIDGQWVEYSCPQFSQFCISVRHLSTSFSAGELIGFNNTGNVCVWPSEEVLAFHCMNNADYFRNKTVCEVGGGMTCLAGLSVAVCSNAAEVLLTDGNQTSAKNIQEIIARNKSKFGESVVTARELKWNQRELFEDLGGHFDCVISADCLFFDQFRQDLVDTFDVLLKPKGEAIIFAPCRGNTLDQFCVLAKTKFEVDVESRYDGSIWRKHQDMLTEGKEVYDENIHYPVRITLKRR